MTDHKKIFTVAGIAASLLSVFAAVLVCYFLQEALVRLTIQLLNNHTHHQ